MTTNTQLALVRAPVSALERLNGPWHAKAVTVYMAIVVAHWVEHLLQAGQLYALGWTLEESRGALGLLFPWLVSSEALHYGYALVMLVGLVLLRPGFTGSAQTWWTAALALQVWHHFEHLLLLGQVLAGSPLFGAAKPTSLIQLLVPRVELHLFYNAVVFAPMAVAVFLQCRRPAQRLARAPEAGS